MILLGDFNYDILKYTKDKYIQEFVDTLFTHHLQPCILEPTRIVARQNPSLIDNIFTNIIDKDIVSGNIIQKVSDHMPNFIIIKNMIPRRKKNKITKRDFSKFSTEDYISDTSKINIDKELDSLDINTIYNDFHNQLINIINKHAPTKTFSVRESKWLQKPWLTKGIQKSIKIKNKLYYQFTRTKDQFWFNRFKVYRNSIRNLARISKKKFYNNYFSSHLRNSKKIWSGINEIIHNNKAKDLSEIFLNIDGNIIDDQTKVANIFNNFFGTVASKLVQKLPKPNTKFQDYLKNPNKHSIYLNEIEPGEVHELLSKLDISKSGDTYNITPKLLKIAANALCNPLTRIFNKSFELGSFPDLLKLAKVIPIHKAGSKMVASNYRPISLLPIISKIFEKVMYLRLYKFIQKNKILCEKQYGFQKGKSTELAILLDLQSKIIDALEKGKKPCSVFLDFAKAFDTVNHDILIHKLNHYGIRGEALSWISSYLKNRKQYVEINNNNSSLTVIENGVPQGSVLGPLLFLLYINDITHVSQVLTFYLFADDTSVFFSHKNIKDLESIVNQELKKLSDWLIANKLTLNVLKSNVVLFKSKNSPNNLSINLEINNSKLEENLSAKYLGIIIDHKLTFCQETEHIKQKLIKGNLPSCKIKTFCTKYYNKKRL